MNPSIPGYYFDTTKNRYFKISDQSPIKTPIKVLLFSCLIDKIAVCPNQNIASLIRLHSFNRRSMALQLFKKSNFRFNTAGTSPIACIHASDSFFSVGRANGSI